MKAEPIAGELARFVEALGIDNIPPEVALRARYLILDAIGCAMAARREEPVPHPAAPAGVPVQGPAPAKGRRGVQGA